MVLCSLLILIILKYDQCVYFLKFLIFHLPTLLFTGRCQIVNCEFKIIIIVLFSPFTNLDSLNPGYLSLLSRLDHDNGRCS